VFKAGKSVPKLGEIRYGYPNEENSQTHKYQGVRPYLIISNDTYNYYSGQSEAVPFTTKRKYSTNPVHVTYQIGEVEGLTKVSTLTVEGRTTLPNSNFSDPIGRFNENNWRRAAKAFVIQNPGIRFAFDLSS